MLADDAPAPDFGAFYRCHLEVVLGFCFARTGEQELAADLTAEVFATALLARERFRPELGSARRWLLGIAAHKIVDAQRRGQVERRAQQRLGMAVITWTEGDLDRVAALGTGGHVSELLAELPRAQRDAIRARVVQERGYPEIADELGVAETTVRKRVSRGLSTIRERLQKEGSDERL